MTDDRRPSDDQLLDHLKDALDNSVEVSDDAIDMLMTGYDIVHTDVIDADLTFDSLEAVGVRDGGSVRQLRFEHGSIRIDVELVDIEQRCLGSVEPPGGILTLEQISGARRLDLGDGGAFDSIIEGVGPFRLTYQLDASTIATDWMQFAPRDG